MMNTPLPGPIVGKVVADPYFAQKVAFLQRALQARAFFVLGAGASSKLVPLTKQLREKIVLRHLAHGMYSAERISLTPGASRIMGDVNAYYSRDEQWGEIKNALLQRIHPGAVLAMAARQLSAPPQLTPPSSYAIFQLAREQLTILNYNLDGLASRYCSRHVVIHPHGVLPQQLLYSDYWDYVIESCLNFGLECPAFDGVLLPGQEPEHIVRSRDFRLAESRYNCADVVVIVGYSFGKNDTGAMDDWASYERLVWMFKRNPVPILLVDPYGDELQHQLESDLHRPVFLLNAYWQHLSACLIQARRIRHLRSEFKQEFRISAEHLYAMTFDEHGPDWVSFLEPANPWALYVPEDYYERYYRF